MSIEFPVNMASLNLVQEELNVTVQTAAAALEDFSRSGKDYSGLIESSREHLNQIAGICSMLQLKGAETLTRAAILAQDALSESSEEQQHVILDKLGEYFFVIPRYMDYVSQQRKSVPNLLLPLINELRAFAKAPALPDSHFFELNTGEVSRNSSAGNSAVYGEDLKPLARRLRHMFQVGLLNVFRDQQVRPSISLMQRAVQRLDKITGNHKLGKLWWLTDAALAVLAFSNTTISKERKLLLGQVDRQIKQLQEKGAGGLDAEPAGALIKELIFILILSGGKNPEANKILSELGIEPSNLTAADIEQERESMRGPSSDTILSLINVLQDELKQVKDTLERASLSGISGIEDFDALASGLKKIIEILSVVGLGSASESLKGQTELLENWKKSGESVDPDRMMEVANTLLYVEGSIGNLSEASLTPEQLEKANSLSQEEVIATSQLADAEISVIREAEAGLSLIKRALHAFAESTYDKNHISNVPSTLEGVKGALMILSQSRAVAVVDSSKNFVQELLDQEAPAAIQQVLETFADAIIGLEYYLDTLASDRNADDNVLTLAEESLEALGFSVS